MAHATLAEVVIAIQAYYLRIREQAWWVALYQRQERLPPLETILTGPPSREEIQDTKDWLEDCEP